MTTFQAIVYAIFHGFAEFLPISVSAHHLLIPYFLGWPAPSGAFAGALALGTLLSLLIYFRHDWASIFSTFLQVIIFRKRPMTLDERLPLFITLSTLPVAALWYYLREGMGADFSSPLGIAASLILLSVPLGLSESMSRKTKGMFDWNWLDSLVVGLGQVLTFLPGGGRTTGAMSGAMMRNYNREAAAKFTYYISLPTLLGAAILNLRGVDFHAHAPMAELSWFTFCVTVVVTVLFGLLAIGGFMKHVQRKGFGGYIAYRCLLALGVGITYWIRSGSLFGG